MCVPFVRICFASDSILSDLFQPLSLTSCCPTQQSCGSATGSMRVQTPSPMPNGASFGPVCNESLQIDKVLRAISLGVNFTKNGFVCLRPGEMLGNGNVFTKRGLHVEIKRCSCGTLGLRPGSYVRSQVDPTFGLKSPFTDMPVHSRFEVARVSFSLRIRVGPGTRGTDYTSDTYEATAAPVHGCERMFSSVCVSNSFAPASGSQTATIEHSIWKRQISTRSRKTGNHGLLVVFVRCCDDNKPHEVAPTSQPSSFSLCFASNFNLLETSVFLCVSVSFSFPVPTATAVCVLNYRSTHSRPFILVITSAFSPARLKPISSPRAMILL